MTWRGPSVVFLATTFLLGLLGVGFASAAEIQGRVVLTGEVPAAKKIPITIDQYVCGTEQAAADLVVSGAREVRNVVVWLENPPAGAPSATPTAATPMDQKDCVFVPRVVIVPPAGTVEFLNSDRLLHNLHSVSRENPSFNRTQPKGRTIPVTFAKPEIVRIDCDLLGYELALGVGIAQGYATIGAIGFESRIDYAAIGTVTNLASRLCDEAAPWQILVSPRVTAEVGHLVELEDVGELTLKGLRRPVPARNVLRTRPSAHAA